MIAVPLRCQLIPAIATFDTTLLEYIYLVCETNTGSPYDLLSRDSQMIMTVMLIVSQSIDTSLMWVWIELMENKGNNICSGQGTPFDDIDQISFQQDKG